MIVECSSVHDAEPPAEARRRRAFWSYLCASASQRAFMPTNPEQMDVVRRPLAPPKAENGAGSSAPAKAIC